MKRLNPETEKKSKNECVYFLRKIFEPEKPLAKMIRTETASGYHLYDTGTNKILQCREQVFELVQHLLDRDVDEAKEAFISRYGEKAFFTAAEEIVSAINEENILQVKKATRFGLSDHFEGIEGLLNSSIQSINLEVTQECNLRCHYCIYHDHVKEKRNYSNKTMSFEVARKAIEFLKRHSAKSDLVVVGFYGGEPLKEFSLICRCVEYTKEIFDKQKVLFTITTNATLITPEIAAYFFENGFSVVLSLDGPMVYHDRYRKDKDGNGSFEKTMKGLKILLDTYGAVKRGKISLNMVYAPPYSGKKLDTINDFLKGLDLPDIIVVTMYPREGSVPMDMVSEKDLKEDKNLIQWAFEKYRMDYDKSDAMVKGVVEKRFAKLMHRPILKEPLDAYFLNGCCVPGYRKNYIDVDGGIHVCEKICTDAPVIGHVETGFDFERIQKVYIDDYAERSLNDCSKCWGLRICDVCYIAAFDAKGELDLQKKKSYCASVLKALEQSLISFTALMEENPERLDYLYQYELR